MPDDYTPLPRSSLETVDVEHDTKLGKSPRAFLRKWTTLMLALNLFVSMLLTALLFGVSQAGGNRSESHSMLPQVRSQLLMLTCPSGPWYTTPAKHPFPVVDRLQFTQHEGRRGCRDRLGCNPARLRSCSCGPCLGREERRTTNNGPPK